MKYLSEWLTSMHKILYCVHYPKLEHLKPTIMQFGSISRM